MSAIAELRAIANLDTKGFEAGASNIKGATGTMVSGLGRIAGAVGAAFSVAAVVGFGRALMTEAAEVKRMADALGIGVGMMEGLTDAARETGASSEGFQQKLVKLSDSQEEAVKGNKESVESFARLGVTMNDLISLSPDKLLERVAKGAQSDATAISDLNNVMGRGAAGEYYQVLQKIGKEGLPAVNAGVSEQIEKFAAMETKYQQIKDKIGHGFMGAVVGIGKALGLTSEPSGQSEFDQQNRAIARARGLEQERARIRTEALDKIHLKEVKQIKDIEDKKAAALEKITVDSPQAADAMARIGGMIGGGMPGDSGAAQRQLKQLEIIADSTKEMTKIQEETKAAIKDLE